MGDAALDPVCEALLVFGSFGTPATKHVDFDAVIASCAMPTARSPKAKTRTR